MARNDVPFAWAAPSDPREEAALRHAVLARDIEATSRVTPEIGGVVALELITREARIRAASAYPKDRIRTHNTALRTLFLDCVNNGFAVADPVYLEDEQ